MIKSLLINFHPFPDEPSRKNLESVIFASRWIQAPLYVGLIVAQTIYCWLFMVELSHLVRRIY